MIDPFLIKGFSYSSFYISNNKGVFFLSLFSYCLRLMLLVSYCYSLFFNPNPPFGCLYVGYWNFPFKRSFLLITYIVFFLLLIIFLFQIQSSINYIYFFFTNYIEYNFNFNFFLLKIMDSYFLYCRIKFFFWVENILKFFTCFIK